jgi:hypothetical protein
MKTPLVQPAQPPAATVSEFIATFAVILVAAAGLLLFDSGLATVDTSARKAFAAKEFVAGERLIARGKIDEGVDRLRASSTLDGENAAYVIALAQATLADGHPRAA